MHGLSSILFFPVPFIIFKSRTLMIHLLLLLLENKNLCQKDIEWLKIPNEPSKKLKAMFSSLITQMPAN